jgi:hypothetical protein
VSATGIDQFCGLIPGAWRSEPGIDADAPREPLPPWTPLAPTENVGTIPGAKYYENSRYHVSVLRMRLALFAGRPQWVYRLGVTNFDHSARHDWRDLQRIKNELVGEEAEGFELYPAESRLLDPSNYFILWVIPVGMGRIPVGVNRRRVLEPDESPAPQRGRSH